MLVKSPIISEKSMKLAKEGYYTFLVDRKARKDKIANLIRKKFAVDVLSVSTANFKEETKRQRSRMGYQTIPGYKKAVVQLKKGQKIDLFEQEKGPAEETKEEVKEKKSLLKGTKVKVERGKTDSEKENQEKKGKEK